MREIFIITNYFPPEKGAASNRIFQLAKGLQNHNFKVSVITPLPNYPKGKIFESYRGKVKDVSVENGITVQRLWLFASNSKNKIIRLFAMLSYSFSLIWFLKRNKIPETVIIQSPPLLVAFTAVLFLRSKKRKLILNVSDLWPLAGLELGAFKKNWGYWILEKIEHFNYKHADLVLGQSDEILKHVLSIFPNKQTFLYRNFPDFEPLSNDLKDTSNSKIKLVYAGLLGHAQGIYRLCSEMDYTNIEFHIYGDGAEREKIEKFILHNRDLPIHFHGELSRKELHQELLKYDITIIPLLNRIYGSVPSKIFEYARLGLPILYFGGGEGESIIKDYELGWIAESGNYERLNAIIKVLNKNKITLSQKKIKGIVENTFNFDNQLKMFLKVVQ